MAKLSVFLVSVAFAMQTANGWVFPKTAIQQAAAIATISTTIATAPLVAGAVDFTGSYADPKHPNCLREIVVTGPVADVTGTDGTPGCPVDGSGRKWELVGQVDKDTIFVDFSPKGGPKGLKGVWEPSPNPGIRWPDGNIWTVKTTSTN